MGQLTYTHAVTGTIGSDSQTFSSTYSEYIRHFTFAEFDVTNAWKLVAPAAQFALYVVINTGTNDALYRVQKGANYYRFNLPAGKVIVIHGRKGLYFAEDDSASNVEVYSTSGTTVQVGVFF